VTKAIFAGQYIKELPFKYMLFFCGSFNTIIPWFTKYFFMGNCPGDTGNGDR